MSEILTTYEVPSGRLYPVYDDSPTSGWVVVYKAADADALLRQREDEVAAWKEKARWKHTHDDSLELELQTQLTAMTAERDALRKAQKNLAGQYNSLSQQADEEKLR